MMRVGHGFDVHAFSDDPARRLVLGGIVFDGERGLQGHSDADVIVHACIDALLGACGLGDVGQHFPDTDDRFKDADSIQMLTHVLRLLSDKGWRVGNVDCTVVCETPKLAPRRDEICLRLTQTVGAAVSVKGKRAEGLGAIGRGEGIACWAVALVER